MQPCKIDNALKEKAIRTLTDVLEKDTLWVKVHAAEYLLWLKKHQAAVRAAFLKEYEQHCEQPKYRIGIFRVLYQTETDSGEKKKWLDKVLAAFDDMNGPDRIHAAETLAKLKTSPQQIFPEAAQEALTDTSRILQTYTRWAISYTSAGAAQQNKKEFINLLYTDGDSIIRKICAYILSKSKNLDTSEWQVLYHKAMAEPDSTALKRNLLQTAFVTYTGGDNEKFKTVSREMQKGYRDFTAAERIELAQALAEKGSCDDIAVLSTYIDDDMEPGLYDSAGPEGSDVRAAAAYAILKIADKESSK